MAGEDQTAKFGEEWQPLTLSKIIAVCDPETLVLSVALNPLPKKADGGGSGTAVAFSLSDGRVGVVDSKESEVGLLKSSSSAKFSTPHSLEAWTVAWSLFENENGGRGLYSGGDDSLLSKQVPKLLSILLKESNGTSEALSYQSIGSDSKTHGAGVTAILPIRVLSNANDEELLVTGSYDEHVRLIMPTNGRRWKVLAEKRLGGGVWRLKLVDFRERDEISSIRVLASCMHAGCRVLHICRSVEAGWTIDVLARFEEHESMNYASDFLLGSEADDERGLTVMSTSFYDRKLCVWKTSNSKLK